MSEHLREWQKEIREKMMTHDMRHMEYLETVAAADVLELRRKEQTYRGSWKRSGGRSAWFMLRRKIDRLLEMMARPETPHGFSLEDLDDAIGGGENGGDVTLDSSIVAYLRDSYVSENIFAKIRENTSGDDGTALAEVRDLRRYLMLVEAEMMARDVVPCERTVRAADYVDVGVQLSETPSADLSRQSVLIADLPGWSINKGDTVGYGSGGGGGGGGGGRIVEISPTPEKVVSNGVVYETGRAPRTLRHGRGADGVMISEDDEVEFDTAGGTKMTGKIIDVRGESDLMVVVTATGGGKDDGKPWHMRWSELRKKSESPVRQGRGADGSLLREGDKVVGERGNGVIVDAVPVGPSQTEFLAIVQYDDTVRQMQAWSQLRRQPERTVPRMTEQTPYVERTPEDGGQHAALAPHVIGTDYLLRKSIPEELRRFWRQIGARSENTMALEAHVESVNIPRVLRDLYVPGPSSDWIVKMERVPADARDHFPRLPREQNTVELEERPTWQQSLYEWDATGTKHVLRNAAWAREI